MFGNKSHLGTSSSNMDYKAGLLVFTTLLVGSLALPRPKDDMSIFFKQNANGRIVGGTEAAVGSHPHMVVLSSGLFVRSFFCGGSLIAPRTVLTAAHCIGVVYLPISGTLYRSLRVTVGTNRHDSGGTAYTIARHVSHPDYDFMTLKNDIGVLITSAEVAYTELVQPVPITFDYIDGGVPAIVAGWGRIYEGGPASDNLLELRTTTLESSDCVERVIQANLEHDYEMYTDPRIEVCTLHSPGFGACNGDSGSALRRIEDGQQFGIVSWGFSCAGGAPDVFVRVGAYESWLNTSHVFWALLNMNYKTGLLVFITLLIGSFAVPTPENDMSIFFDHTDANARIVGGTQAAVGSHPHMVALSSGVLIRSFLCGGSLITQRTVLTAAHCIAAVFSGGSLVSSLRATVGTNRWNSGGVAYILARNVTHPNYVSATIKNDIGVLITSSNVALNNLVQVVPITYSFIGQGVQARVAGWGRIRTGGSLSAALLELTTHTIEGNDCVARAARAAIDLNMRNAPPVEPHIEVCTFHSAGFGNCNGDSGSALRRVDNGQQFGIVSWGFPCARGAPDMFVRISAYQNWLRSVIV
ncbi:unnamed protein product [Spodoptera exigua]|nr:unnamed protein product [Spodoptera exigua]